MKIIAVEPIPLRIPFSAPFKISQGEAREALDVVIVRIHTDEGIVGVGETQAWRRQGSAETLVSLVRTIQDHFAPVLRGRSPFDIVGILHALNGAMYNTLYAQAAVGDALYDIVGRALGVPVHTLLGGECRSRVRIGAILSMKPDAEELIESAQAAYEEGFRHFGLKIGVDAALDVKNVAALRAQFGDRVVLRVDANGALSYDAAAALLRKIEPYDIDAAEQPVAIWDVAGLAALSRTTTIPIMADESVSTAHSLIEIIRQRAATVVQTKIAKNGGIHRVNRLWEVAAAAGMRIFPGNHPSTSVATAAAAHVCGAWPGPLMEGPFAVGRCGTLAADIVTNPIAPENGEVQVPAGPGLGVELDMERVAALRVDL
ncbi:MAG TPA: mandelate racemase/muconate lactonizing enzyme family protein [Candidatus Bathyarchaeia archaeon]|nr:mandelate racemase/muconate lactonizing enzyme family protein [Candidatus Bathyarchaeia archaeon]